MAGGELEFKEKLRCQGETSSIRRIQGNDFEQEIKQVQGTTTVALVNNNRVIFGVDSRLTSTVFRHIISENYQKFRFITKSVLATFSGDVKSFEDMCEVLSSKVEEYKKMSIESTADMVSRWAFDLMENTNYSMLIIGAENEKGTIYFVEKGDRKVITDWKIIGSGEIYGKTEMENYDVQMSEDKAVDMVLKVLLTAALFDSTTGGNIIVYKCSANEFKRIIGESVPRILLQNHDKYEPENTLFILTLDIINHKAMDHWIRSTFPGVDLIRCHSIGFVRGNFYLHRVLLGTGSPVRVTDIYARVLRKFDGRCAPSTDLVVQKLPFIYVCQARCYFAEACKLEELCEDNVVFGA